MNSISLFSKLLLRVMQTNKINPIIKNNLDIAALNINVVCLCSIIKVDPMTIDNEIDAIIRSIRPI
jgi:hypothetical protein